jgi:hypothetical protein
MREQDLTDGSAGNDVTCFYPDSEASNVLRPLLSRDPVLMFFRDIRIQKVNLKQEVAFNRVCRMGREHGPETSRCPA